MKNLKKVMALTLSIAMIFSFMANAAFSDVELSGDYAVEISALSNLGILNGYPDGTFLPNGTLTRAEAAAVIYLLLIMRPRPRLCKRPSRTIPKTIQPIK